MYRLRPSLLIGKNRKLYAVKGSNDTATITVRQTASFAVIWCIYGIGGDNGSRTAAINGQHISVDIQHILQFPNTLQIQGFCLIYKPISGQGYIISYPAPEMRFQRV